MEKTDRRTRSTVCDQRVPPRELCRAPVPDQIPCLDRLRHVADPDPNEFVNNFFVESDTL